MTVYEILIEARELLKIMLAPTIVGASIETMESLGKRRAAFAQQKATDISNYEPTFLHELFHIQCQIYRSGGAGPGLYLDNKICAPLLERTEELLTHIKTADVQGQFRSLINYVPEDQTKPLGPWLVSFSEWLASQTVQGKSEEADQGFINLGYTIVKRIRTILEEYPNHPASFEPARDIICAHVDHMHEQFVAAEQYTRMSVMDNAIGSWDTITDTIVEMANWIPADTNEPRLTPDEVTYKTALTNCVEAFLGNCHLPGVGDDVLEPLRQKLIEHYMEQYKKDGNYLDKPVKELTDFMNGTVALTMATSQNIGEHRAHIVKSIYTNQLPAILDDIMQLKGPRDSTLTPGEHVAVCRLMQIIHINGLMAGAQEVGVVLSPATYSVQVGLMKSVLRHARDLLEKNVVKDMFVYRLLDKAILVTQQNMYSGGYKHDERTALIKAETFEEMFTTARDYLAVYFHSEVPTLSQV